MFLAEGADLFHVNNDSNELTMPDYETEERKAVNKKLAEVWYNFSNNSFLMLFCKKHLF